MNHAVTSREYKFRLQAARFGAAYEGIEALWRLLKFLALERLGGKLVLEQREEEVRRVFYLDTQRQGLHGGGYSLRLREEAASDGSRLFRLTLGFRHEDRYVAAAQEMGFHLGDGSRVKRRFAEEVFPRRRLYTQTTGVHSRTEFMLVTFGQALLGFPGLSALPIEEGEPLFAASGLRITERVLKLGVIRFGPHLAVRVWVSLWHVYGMEEYAPALAELTLAYDLPGTDDSIGVVSLLEIYPAAEVEQVHRWVSLLMKHKDLIEFEEGPKEDFVYGRF